MSADSDVGFEQLEDMGLEGERVAVGFRPSGELHLGNLLTITYAAVLADRLDLKLDLMCCDTDWSAHLKENHRPDDPKTMKLFFQRDCSCETKDTAQGESFSKKTSGKVLEGHRNIAEHRMEQIKPFIAALEESLEVEVETGFLTDLQGDEGYMEALRNVLDSMHELDSFFGGVFSSRYRSPVVNVCEECGFSHAKGSVYSENTDELVFECRNSDCDNWFAASGIDEEIGVYYLVDPVRDPSRNVAVHVFGGDYRDAEKGQKTSKLEKVAKITELANGETPEYFVAPMISDEEGKPLSKSKGTGKTVSEIDDLESFAVELASRIEEWINEGREHVSQEELME